MARPQTAANSVGKISLTPYFLDDSGLEKPVPREARAYWPRAAITQYRVRCYARLQDRTQQDPATGAYLTGPRVEIAFWTKNPDPLAAAQRVAEEVKRRQAQMLEEQQLHLQRMQQQTQQAVVSRQVGELAEEALQQALASGEIAETSGRVYEAALKRIQKDPLATVDITAAGAADITAFLERAVLKAPIRPEGKAQTGGVGSARHCRTLLNRTFSLAIHRGLVTNNPVRDSAPIRTRRRGNMGTGHKAKHDLKRVMTDPERLRLALSVCRSEAARRNDVRDLILSGFAIGGRISEAIAIRWSDVTVIRGTQRELEGWVHINASIKYIRGKGLERGSLKADSSERTIPLPRRVVALLVRRAASVNAIIGQDLRPVFPAPGRWDQPAERMKWRDPSNTDHAIRKLLDEAGFDWASFHALRRTAITRLADTLPIRQAADYAGHASVRTTMDHYLGRTTVSQEVARHL